MHWIVSLCNWHWHFTPCDWFLHNCKKWSTNWLLFSSATTCDSNCLKVYASEQTLNFILRISYVWYVLQSDSNKACTENASQCPSWKRVPTPSYLSFTPLKSHNPSWDHTFPGFICSPILSKNPDTTIKFTSFANVRLINLESFSNTEGHKKSTRLTGPATFSKKIWWYPEMLRLTMDSSVGNGAQLLIILDKVQNISLTTFNKYARVQTPYSDTVQ
jgi:hypothetical protein